MRFLADGPSLPDELLLARDEGRVLFFCGAGVSRANANLPGFLGLAERVLAELRALPDSPARKFVDIATMLQGQPIKGVGSILAADRIFGLLERDFALEDIERAVGRALTPADGVDLAAHHTMLNLSKNPAGEAQLVTTNFDLLFEKANPRLNVWTPSQLPDLKRNETFQGIVHLHGMFDPHYGHAVGGNLVLSSAEFGRAYLAEGWATEFIRSAIARYLIVFVGYTADDPPVQYLLEALNRLGSDRQRLLYAFQEGRQDEAEALWKQKGVTAIAYQAGANHKHLWETLEAWADRARAPEQWRARLISRAQRGPEAMAPHERGQIVHLAATPEGAQALAEAKKPIPGEWLCVFDPRIRFSPPGRTNFERIEAADADPFVCYGLDSDPEPPKPNEKEVFPKREIPDNALNPLLPVLLDGTAPFRDGLCGEQSSSTPIPQRLVTLAVWFTRVCGQPAALWWAAGQNGLHPVMVRNVQFELDNKNSTLGPVARASWRYLIEAWRWPKDNDLTTAYALNQRLATEGWNRSTRRAYLNLLRPVLTASRPYGVRPPATARGLLQRQVLSLSVEYSHEEIEVPLPDSEVKAVLPALRKLLEDAGALETEIRPYDINIPPIEPDPNLPGESSDRTWGPNPQILRFAALFRMLIQQDHGAALREFSAWAQEDDPIFERMRLWAAGIRDLLDAVTSGKIFCSISDRVFWGGHDQRDLLAALSRRWRDLSADDRHALGARLRKGLPRERRRYDPALYPKWRAHSILQRLTWLDAQGCQFDFEVKAVLAKAQQALPEWRSEDALHAADSMEGRGGTVRVDTSFSDIADTPFESLLETALTARARRYGFLQEHDPYAGLVQQKPLRVLAALRRELVPSDIAQRAWTHFLQSMARQKDTDRLCKLIALRLANTPPKVLETILLPASYWLDNSAKRLFASDTGTARILFDVLMASIRDNPELALPKAQPGTRRNWFEASWNSVVGHLAACLLADPELTDSKFKAGIPKTWKGRADRLLQLPGDVGRLALAQLARHLSWLHARDPDWVVDALITPMRSEGPNRDAALGGFFSNATIQGEDLFDRLKPILMAPIVDSAPIDTGRDHALASIFITAWHVKTDAGMRFLSDEDLRLVIVHGEVA